MNDEFLGCFRFENDVKGYFLLRELILAEGKAFSNGGIRQLDSDKLD